MPDADGVIVTDGVIVCDKLVVGACDGVMVRVRPPEMDCEGVTLEVKNCDQVTVAEAEDV